MNNLKPKGLTDMTQGSALKHIFTFAMPLLFGSIFQQLYNMVDSIVVGRFVGDTALAAVGTAFPVVFLLASLFMGLGIGATIIVSQYFGAGDLKRVKDTIDTTYTGLIIAVIPLTILALLLCKPILIILNVPADAMAEAEIYMMIVLGGFAANLGYSANSGILQGLGDSRTPLLFLVIASVINIVLDLLFVVIFNWGVAGVAIATVIAQTFSWLFGIFYINKKYPQLAIKPFCMKFDKELFGKIVKLGIPAGIQQALFSIGVMAMQRLVNGYGSAFAAGYNGANKIDMFAFLPVQSFSTAVTTFVGQNIGAGKPDRVHKGTVATLKLSLAFSIVLSILTLLTGEYLMQMFSTEPAVIASGMAYLWRMMPFYFIFAIMFVLNCVMRGAGEMKIPMLSSILSLWLARVPASYILAHFFGVENMHYSFAIGWLIGIAVTLPYYLSGKWKKKGLVVTHEHI